MVNKVLSLGIILVLMVSSCSMVEDGNHGSDSNDIGFAVRINDNNNTTKSSSCGTNMVENYGDGVYTVEVSPLVTDNAILTKGSKIEDIKHLGTSGVFAYYTKDGSTFATYMNNQMISYSSINGESSYTPTKYWPANDGVSYLNFYGYAPYMAVGVTGSNGLLLSGGTNPSVTYQLPTATTDHPDFMIAARQTNVMKGSPAVSVPQIFRHALASVGVQIYGNGQAIYSVKITNVNKKGSIELSNVTSSTPISWTLDGTKGDCNATLQFDPSKDYVKLNPVTSNVMASDSYYMMLPQNLEDDSNIVIEYEVVPGDPTTRVTKTIPIKQGALTQWKAGYCYNYNIIITPFTYFNVIPPTNEYIYAGGKSEYIISSYYIDEGSTVKVPLSWTATYVQDDGETPTAAPSWISLSSGMSGTGGDATSYEASVDQEITTDTSPEDDEIRAAAVKTDYDLSADGKTANCYIVNAAGTYKFLANVMGNGDEGMFTGAVDYTGASITSPAIDLTNSHARLLWQDRPGAIRNVLLNGNYINFETASQSEIFQANGVIAIVNNGSDMLPDTSDDEIMWSWHIWITNLNRETSTFTLNFGTPKTMFLRPLGYVVPAGMFTSGRSIKVRFVQEVFMVTLPAVVVEFKQMPTSETPQHYALFYQAGRKDPILSTTPFDGATETMFDVDNNTISYNFVQSLSEITPFDPCWSKALEKNPYSLFIKHPVMVQMRNKATWSQGITSKVSLFWGGTSGVKTIYDPSPYGYKVPPVNTFNGISKVAANPTADGFYNLYINNEPTPGTVLLPAVGYIYRHVTNSNDPPRVYMKQKTIYYFQNINSNTYGYNDNCLVINSSGITFNAASQANCYPKAVLPIKYK